MKLKKAVLVSKVSCVSVLIMFIACRQEQKRVEKIMEDGVEVVLNHVEPYKIKREHTTFTLEKEFVIDTERDDLAKMGITDIDSFDVDSEGNIYVLCLQNDNELIHKFDNKGNRAYGFARKGQGPGEFQMFFYFRINSRNEIIVTANQKILIFDNNGNFLKQIKIEMGTSAGTLLDNGNYLFEDAPMQIKEKSGKTASNLSLYDPGFKKIKDLDRIEYPDPGSQDLNALYNLLFWAVDGQRIFSASQDRGYEILVFDLNGNPLRKIRKEYRKIPISDEYKEEYKKNLGSRMYEILKNRLYYSLSLPPFHYFLTDEEERIFVRTYEKGDLKDESIYDIFDSEGLFISRKSMSSCQCSNYLYFSAVNFVNGKIKNGRFYCLNEKESGFRELRIYKMRWE